MSTKKDVGLAIVRCLAIFFVIAVHFFCLNTPFLRVPCNNVSVFMQATALSVFLTGVPLFMMLTGYLNVTKTSSWNYYKGIKKVIASYLFYSVITILFRKYYSHDTLSWSEWGLKILDFSAIPYAWYIEMWIGLYLLTPFLNILYKNVGEQREKQMLIGILFVVTTLPHWLNRGGMHLFPGFWQDCWPLIYYFVGAYIHEYQVRVNRGVALLAILLLSLLNPVLNVLIGTDSFMLLGGGAEDILAFFMAILLFLVCYRLNPVNVIIKNTVVHLSLLSLDVYLVCFIFDTLFYPPFKEAYYISQGQFGIYFFILVPLVLFSSYAVALLKKAASQLMKTF